jgi:peptidylprolyl isomerase domain and WD repeat-containing protein 1
LGDAKLNQQMQLARSSGSSIAMGDKKRAEDSLIVALAYQQRRFYVFSHTDPLKEEDNDAISRDIWNEAPTAQDRLLGSEGGNQRGSSQASSFAKAILRTTMGDIHIKLFQEVPKTLENFCGHARAGYYDNVIFHRYVAVRFF